MDASGEDYGDNSFWLSYQTQTKVCATLTPAIRRVSKGTQQKRHMIVLSGILNLKNDCHLRIEGLDVIAGEIFRGIENQTVHTGFDCCFVGKEIRNPAIWVRCSLAEQDPAGGSFHFKSHRYASGRPAARSIEHVRCNGAHLLRNFSNLRRVILFCSSAAMRNSVCRSFSIRPFRIASISLEDLPLAQTMKMNPNRSSYSRF